MKRISDTEVQLTDDEMILGDFYQYLRTERGLTDEQAMAYLERVSSLAGRLIHGEFLAYLTDGEPLAAGRCEMAPESPSPEDGDRAPHSIDEASCDDPECECSLPPSRKVTQIQQGKFTLVEGREYRITTLIHGVERKPRYSRMGFMGRRYQRDAGSDLEFSGRGPDRTHSGRYCGTASVPQRSILFVEEVERDDVLRYAFQRTRLD